MSAVMDHSHGVADSTGAGADADPARRTRRVVGRAKHSLINRATGLVNVPSTAVSRWYVATGEGNAVSAGNDELKDVELDDVLGNTFAHALQSVVEVTKREGLDGSQRLRATQQLLSDKLADGV